MSIENLIRNHSLTRSVYPSALRNNCGVRLVRRDIIHGSTSYSIHNADVLQKERTKTIYSATLSHQLKMDLMYFTQIRMRFYIESSYTNADDMHFNCCNQNLFVKFSNGNLTNFIVNAIRNSIARPGA